MWTAVKTTPAPLIPIPTGKLANQPSYESVQWDELITFEHSRLKPLSVAVMSCTQSRCIIAYGVAPIPASGQLAPRSVEKYGKRRDNIKRLTRKTWCTTKSADVLDDVIAIYVHFHNTTLVV